MPSFKGALSFGFFLAGFNGLSCQFRQARGRSDAINPAAAGGIIGLLFSLPAYLQQGPVRGNARLVATNAVLTAGLGAALHIFTHSVDETLLTRGGGKAAHEQLPGATILPQLTPLQPSHEAQVDMSGWNSQSADTDFLEDNLEDPWAAKS